MLMLWAVFEVFFDKMASFQFYEQFSVPNTNCLVLSVQLTGRRVVGDVYDWRSEEILQRHEEAGFQTTTKTDTKAEGTFESFLYFKWILFMNIRQSVVHYYYTVAVDWFKVLTIFWLQKKYLLKFTDTLFSKWNHIVSIFML